MKFRPVLAIAKLTVNAAFRSRLAAFLFVGLAGALTALPHLVKHNGSAEMFTQVILAYTSALVGAVLGLATLWLACGSMAQDITQRQIQLVATKPVASWQIWLGKWLGIAALNSALLAASAFAIYGLIHWHARTLAPDQQAALRERVLIARGSIKEPKTDRNAEIDRIAARRLEDDRFKSLDPAFLRRQVALEIEARDQIVQPNFRRIWDLKLDWRAGPLKDRATQIRARFFAANAEVSALHPTLWRVGDPSTGRFWSTNIAMAANAHYEFSIPPNLYSENGDLRVECHNKTKDVAFLFPIDDGLELLVPEGSFLMNLLRAVGVMFCSLSILAALGLTAATFLSFPVAAFLSLAALLAATATPMLSEVVSDGTLFASEDIDDKPNAAKDWIDWLLVPAFDQLARASRFIADESPIERLSAGRSVSFADLSRAFAKNVLALSGFLGAAGVFIFRRRELDLAGRSE